VLNLLSADSARALWELATGEDGFLLELKTDPGRLGLETLLEEIAKLRRAKALGLPADLFGGVSDKLVASWRARAMASHPSDLAANQPPVRLTLMAALAWSRTSEIADALVDLFINLVSKINTRAERKVERAMEAEAKKVHRKTEKLFSIAEASLKRPDDTVRRGGLPGGAGRGSDAQGAGRRGQGRSEGLQGAGAYGADVVVLQLLPADAAQAAGRDRVQVQQHLLPAGDGRAGAAAALRRHPQQRPALRRFRDRPGQGRGARRVAGGGGQRRRCHRAGLL
jgi:hypothetical protein